MNQVLLEHFFEQTVCLWKRSRRKSLLCFIGRRTCGPQISICLCAVCNTDTEPIPCLTKVGAPPRAVPIIRLLLHRSTQAQQENISSE
jgi:hypothetical protein